ncbi:hypothetical protein Pla108_23760 [Botrimarina colliarenosi]|uniref:Uncharacterized protein n=1 Tax=Botrimarina colliarenosi TaxID=2528001 RepID=A0A5C6AB70_9BACT|nr:hypothetical protein [Botrimarina colliarenosi]TWT96607.1 hypothetical protein Pla108_23760 [Botrimarina colliarenosi]
MNLTIQIPDLEMDRLTLVAKEYGYDDVREYIKDCVVGLIHADTDESASLTDEELRESAARCDEGMADVLAGRVMSVEQARQRLHARLGRLRA